MKLKKLSPISIPAIPSTTTSFHAATLISTYLEWGQKIRKAWWPMEITNKSKPTRTLSTGSMAVAGPLQITHANAKSKLIGLMERSQPPGSLTLEPCLTALRPQVWTVLKSSLQRLGSLLGTTTTAKTASWQVLVAIQVKISIPLPNWPTRATF